MDVGGLSGTNFISTYYANQDILIIQHGDNLLRVAKYIKYYIYRSLCQNRFNAKWKTIAEEENLNQKMHFKSLLQRVIFI